MSLGDELERALPRYLPASGAGALATLCLLIMAVWAALTPVEIVVTAPGSVRPLAGAAELRAADGRSVLRVLVEEGQRVGRGTLLMELEPRPIREQWRAAARKLESTRQALAARREARRVLDTGALTESVREPAVRLHVAAHRSRLAQLDDEARAQRSQRTSLLHRARALRGRLDLEQRRHRSARRAWQAGALSELELSQARQAVHSALAELEAVEAEVAGLNERISAQQHARRSFDVGYRQVLLQEVERLEAALADQEGRVAELAERARLGRITAPMDGVVARLLTRSGAFVQRGETVAVLVPQDDAMVFESRLAPRQVAFLRAGQACRIKLDALPFARYGALPCTLASIGHDVVRDGDGPGHYLARVRPAAQELLADGQRVRLQPGATGWVDIVAGSRTVLSFVTEPLWRFTRESLRER